MARRRDWAGPEGERRTFERINSLPAWMVLGPVGTLVANLVYALARMLRPYRSGRRR